jgi:ATP-binding cassette subfamily F protein uup
LRRGGRSDAHLRAAHVRDGCAARSPGRGRVATACGALARTPYDLRPMPILTFDRVSIAFGPQALLLDASLQIDAGERVCLIGRNGAGKSTLLKIADGETVPDAGAVWRQPGLAVARLAQELPCDEGATVYDVVASGLPRLGRLLAEFHQLSHALGKDASLLRRMDTLQHEIDACNGWSMGQRIEGMLARLELAADARIATLSGGWRRRTALAQALVGEPDLLLLDEPTNHLDIELIQWLEDRLRELRGAVLFVTHDRALLERLATRIVELDRGALTSWDCDYATFLTRKAAALEEEARQAALFDKKLSQEETWIRQGIKARRTRNEGRVRALLRMRDLRAKRREVMGKVRLALDDARPSGQLVAEAQSVAYAFGPAEPPIVRDLTLRVMRGDRIGLIGPNGAGKTTLLRLLVGELTPTAGQLRLGTNLEIAYYDQLRAALDLEKTVIDNLAPGREFVDVKGQRRHVISYLQDFLFSPERARTPMRSLSGGERNRLLLARLFAQPANVLVLDEPTNDLDIETLELLEELLVDYSGTLLLVSHDRAFLDNIVTSTLVFEGGGRIAEYVGGYTDWLRQRAAATPPPGPAPSRPAAARRSGAEPQTEASAKPKPRKLGFKEARELDELPAKIESLESEQSTLIARLSEPAFYTKSVAEQQAVHLRIAALRNDLEAAYTRWTELEALRGG